MINPNGPQRPYITLDPLIMFKPDEIVLDKQEAICVLAYFFNHPGVLPDDLTENDLSFSQALLIEAIELSYGINFSWANREIYLSKQIARLAVNVMRRTNGQWNQTAALESIIRSLLKHGISYFVRGDLNAKYLMDWIARVKARVPAY